MQTFDALIQFIAEAPAQPDKWTKAYVQNIIDRCNKRIRTLQDRTSELPLGQKTPELDQVVIGGGKHYWLSVLFLDISSFSSWPSGNHAEQVVVLQILNVFMAEMMNIVRDFGGTFEKNTGDGLMAYFGTDTKDELEAVRQAVHCAVVMHYVNDILISPWLASNGGWPIHFRAGIDCGEVTIGRVGVPGGLNAFVAIGSTANSACKIMDMIPGPGICVGELVQQRLPRNWSRHAQRITQSTGFVYVASQQPYPAYRLDYRLAVPNL